MRIEVCRTGGFAGMSRSWCVHLDRVENPGELGTHPDPVRDRGKHLVPTVALLVYLFGYGRGR